MIQKVYYIAHRCHALNAIFCMLPFQDLIPPAQLTMVSRNFCLATAIMTPTVKEEVLFI